MRRGQQRGIEGLACRGAIALLTSLTGFAVLVPARWGRRQLPRRPSVHKVKHAVCTTDEISRRSGIQSEALGERILQQQRKVPDQADQEIAIAACAQSRVFGGVAVTGN